MPPAASTDGSSPSLSYGEATLHVDNPEDCFLAQDVKLCAEIEQEAGEVDYKFEIVWKHVFFMALLHIGTVGGLYLMFSGTSMWQTFAWALFIAHYVQVSITGGAHRLWTHKAFKANYGVRLFFMIGTTLAMENHVIWWALQHRCHHKWTDSDADPHNAKRGFFFSHMGWLLIKRHPKTIEMGKKIDMSDLEADELLVFQRDYLKIITPLFYAIVSWVPWYFWGETFVSSILVAGFFRAALQYHMTWMINSVAHLYGDKPFDKTMSAVDNIFASIWTGGEAWHNFHHVFPQDYRASEYMWKANLTGAMLDFFAYQGWIWDRKIMSKEAIERQKRNYGDHSRPVKCAVR